MKSQKTKKFLFTIMILLIIAGAFNAITTKIQNKQYVYEGVYYKEYFHPYMQVLAMFFGQFVCLILFLFSKYRNPAKYRLRQGRAKQQGKSNRLNKVIIIIPAVMDCITSTMHFTALNFIPGSIYQIMRGSTIITTLMLSIFLLKKKIKKHEIIGCSLILFGVIIVALSHFVLAHFEPQFKVNNKLQILGYILVLALSFTHAFIYVFQQMIMNRFYIEPIQLVGYEGLWGLLICVFCIPIISLIPCNFGIEICVFTKSNLPFLQVPSMYLSQVKASQILFYFTILGVISISISNIAGVNVTKHISALTRSVCDVTRILIIWVFGIAVSITLGKQYPNYKWQLVTVKAISIQIFGFVILIIGNLIYNGFIKLPFLKTKRLDGTVEDIEEIFTQKKVYEDDLTYIL